MNHVKLCRSRGGWHERLYSSRETDEECLFIPNEMCSITPQLTTMSLYLPLLFFLLSLFSLFCFSCLSLSLPLSLYLSLSECVCVCVCVLMSVWMWVSGCLTFNQIPPPPPPSPNPLGSHRPDSIFGGRVSSEVGRAMERSDRPVDLQPHRWGPDCPDHPPVLVNGAAKWLWIWSLPDMLSEEGLQPKLPH